MDRDPAVHSTNLLDREERIIADILHRFSNLVVLATEAVGSRASTGQAAYNSMAMEIETRGMIKSAEDLLSLTRLLRELWVIGPLRRPGEGEQETQDVIDRDVQAVVGLVNGLRYASRERMVAEGGSQGRYVSAAMEVPRMDGVGGGGGGSQSQPGAAGSTQPSQSNGMG